MAIIKAILWDIDGTLLDFRASQAAGIRHCFAHFRLGECTDDMLTDYDAVNEKYWKALERGETTKAAILEDRFYEFFRNYGLPEGLVPDFNREYESRLGDTVVFCPHAWETVEQCKALGLGQYAVTNGSLEVQRRKLRSSGLSELLDGAFISDEIGFEKPSPGFFVPVLARLGKMEKTEILIVGDSLTSDMLGGVNAGIKTCWLRSPGQENSLELPLDYVIEDLREAVKIVSG